MRLPMIVGATSLPLTLATRMPIQQSETRFFSIETFWAWSPTTIPWSALRMRLLRICTLLRDAAMLTPRRSVVGDLAFWKVKPSMTTFPAVTVIACPSPPPSMTVSSPVRPPAPLGSTPAWTPSSVTLWPMLSRSLNVPGPM